MGKKSLCATSIWKMFSDIEKQMWLIFYKSFLASSLYPTELNNNKSRDIREVIAHNLAIEAVWMFRYFCEINFGHDRKMAARLKKRILPREVN